MLCTGDSDGMRGLHQELPAGNMTKLMGRGKICYFAAVERQCHKQTKSKMQIKTDKNSLAVSPLSIIYFYLTLVLFAGKGNVKGETFN